MVWLDHLDAGGKLRDFYERFFLWPVVASYSGLGLVESREV
jgi:hypothetical protein